MEGLNLSNRAKESFSKASKWAKFLAILGFIGTGLGFIYTVLMLANGGGYYAGGIIISFIITLGTTLLPAIFLNRFSNQAKKAAGNDDSNMLELSLGSLNATLKTYGIIAIVTLSLTVIGLVLFAASGGW